jgi:hypothetical protein
MIRVRYGVRRNLFALIIAIMAAYKLLNEHNEEVTLHDLQDKGPWCRTGATFEEVFIEKYGKELDLIINPAKATNIYAPDLFNKRSNRIADLKTQNTPFFQARTRYNQDPQFTVTFNEKDFVRYSSFYPSIEIYFWVKWIVTKFVNNNGVIEVHPMEGIWKIDFDSLFKLCSTSPIHSYAQRINDKKGNAKGSYVLNLNHPSFTRLK